MPKHFKSVAKVCAYCGRTFTAEPNRLRTGHGKYCTKYCANSAREIDPITYFWAHVRKSADPDGCWEWTGTINPTTGYGVIIINRKSMPTHRFSYLINVGPIPDGLWVLHRCDNRRCIRTSHVFLGTCKDNMVDAQQKGRLPIGESHSQSKLTSEQVKEIRYLHEQEHRCYTDIANEFGVSDSNICYIVNRQTWRHVK